MESLVFFIKFIYFFFQRLIMIGNIVGILVLAVWLIAVAVYIIKQKRNARLSGNHICIGCPGAAGCKKCHCK